MENLDDKVTVLCVKFGPKYGREYAMRLKNMVDRHLTIPHDFVCLTDDHHHIDGIKSIIQKPGGYNKPWWHKVHMFDPALPLSGRILYLDLDVVVHKNIDKLVANAGNKFFGIRDFNRKFYPKWNQLNSSVMSWIHGTQRSIYDEFNRDRMTALRLHGDQDWIWRIARTEITFWPDEWIQSYKWEIRSREELKIRTGQGGFRTNKDHLKMHPECSIAVFHGEPNPHDVKDKFVMDNWK